MTLHSIKTLDNSPATSPDNRSNFHIKHLSPVTIQVHKDLFNHSWSHSKTCWQNPSKLLNSPSLYYTYHCYHLHPHLQPPNQICHSSPHSRALVPLNTTAKICRLIHYHTSCKMGKEIETIWFQTFYICPSFSPWYCYELLLLIWPFYTLFIGKYNTLKSNQKHLISQSKQEIR